MARAKTTIELNGKSYNALTGSMMGNGANPQPAVSGNVIDGFVRRVGASSKSARKPGRPRTGPAAGGRHKPQKTMTLMRHAVVKPAPAQALDGLKNHRHDDPARAERAHSIRRSRFVSKFSASQPPLIKRQAPLSVAPERAVATPSISANSPEQPPKPETAPLKDMFSQAINRATAHEAQPLPATKHKSKKRRRLAIGAVSASLVIALVAVLAYRNVPRLAVSLAAARAGLSASLPSYQPSGFSVKGPIQYSPGQVSVNFKSQDNERGFKIVERTSSWNPDALLTNYVNTSNRPYQIFQDRGRTIYLYDSGNATWVDQGIWYQIESNGALSSDQLLRIASSF